MCRTGVQDFEDIEHLRDIVVQLLVSDFQILVSSLTKPDIISTGFYPFVDTPLAFWSQTIAFCFLGPTTRTGGDDLSFAAPW